MITNMKSCVFQDNAFMELKHSDQTDTVRFGIFKLMKTVQG